MPETLSSIRSSIQTFLGDSTIPYQVWTPAEIDRYIQEGYDRLASLSLCLWTFSYLDDVAATATYSLPSDLVAIDRVTWNYRRLPFSRLTELSRIDRNFNTIQGQPLTISNDGDGLLTIRKYPIPSTAGSVWDTITGTWGISRDLSTILSGQTGTWGIPRNTGDGSTGSWGMPRRPFKDQTNTRLEYFRRGTALTTGSPGFDIPDRYVKYVRHFALYRALERKGPGQDMKLAAHYLARFNAGIARMLARKEVFQRSQTIRLGGTTRDRAAVQYPKLPWQYGQVVRYP